MLLTSGIVSIWHAVWECYYIFEYKGQYPLGDIAVIGGRIGLSIAHSIADYPVGMDYLLGN